MIHFECEHCGHAVRVPAAHAGKKGRCPSCKAVVDIPSSDHDVPPPPAQNETAAEEFELPSPDEDPSGDTDILPGLNKPETPAPDDPPQQAEPLPTEKPAEAAPPRNRRTAVLIAAIVVVAVVVIALFVLLR